MIHWMISISLVVFKIKKKFFEKKGLSGSGGLKNVLTEVEIRLKYFYHFGIESLPWTAQLRQYFPKISGGGCLFEIY